METCGKLQGLQYRENRRGTDLLRLDRIRNGTRSPERITRDGASIAIHRQRGWGSSGQGRRLASDRLLSWRESEAGRLNTDVRLRERKEQSEKESPKQGSPERADGLQH